MGLFVILLACMPQQYDVKLFYVGEHPRDDGRCQSEIQFTLTKADADKALASGADVYKITPRLSVLKLESKPTYHIEEKEVETSTVVK